MKLVIGILIGCAHGIESCGPDSVVSAPVEPALAKGGVAHEPRPPDLGAQASAEERHQVHQVRSWDSNNVYSCNKRHFFLFLKSLPCQENGGGGYDGSALACFTLWFYSLAWACLLSSGLVLGIGSSVRQKDQFLGRVPWPWACQCRGRWCTWPCLCRCRSGT